MQRKMQRREIAWRGMFLLACPLLLLPPGEAAAQRGGQVECSEVVEAVRDARSLTELRQRVMQKTSDEETIRRCGHELDSDPAIGSMARAELQQVELASQRAFRQVTATSAPEPDPMQLAVNQRVLEAQRVGTMRVQQLKGTGQLRQRDEPAPERAPAPSTPEAQTPMTITNVVPPTFVPGTDFAIEGSGFTQGDEFHYPSVRLNLNQGSGSAVELLVTGWSETHITGVIPAHLSGVVDTNTARLRVRVGSREAERFIAFAPIYVTEKVSWVLKRPADTPWWELAGVVKENIFPGSKLVNNWRIKESEIRHNSGIVPPHSSCTSSSLEAGQTSLAGMAHLLWFFPNTSSCSVVVRIEGPRGTATGL